MDLRKQKPSRNFEDRTNYGEMERFLETLFLQLNPLYLQRKIKDKYLENGYIQPQTKELWRR